MCVEGISPYTISRTVRIPQSGGTPSQLALIAEYLGPITTEQAACFSPIQALCRTAGTSLSSCLSKDAAGQSLSQGNHSEYHKVSDTAMAQRRRCPGQIILPLNVSMEYVTVTGGSSSSDGTSMTRYLVAKDCRLEGF